MRIAVDAMGGDYAPKEIVAGAALAAKELDARICLAGDPDAIASELPDDAPQDRIEVIEARDVIGMGESPRGVLRGRDDTSMARAVDEVASDAAKAVFSAGNSGAFMALSVMRMGTIPGVKRPAIAVTMPNANGHRVLLDAGANADCRPEHLVDFGLMGAVYAEYALGIDNPRVGLLSIGEEKGKGNELTKAAHELLEAADLNFVGNVEGGDVFGDECDVVVCDGFVGNVVLKATEGAAALLMRSVQQAVMANPELKSMAPVFGEALKATAGMFDASEYGGALLLGVNGVSIVGHGCSDANAARNAVRFAQRAVQGRLVEHLREVFAERAERLA
ncbi:MAG: phosphate acyltransferase PlsX [Armatimonadia bacterium]|nr:phosphate acyltransferase PlsX [Armatimonadia bacterium]